MRLWLFCIFLETVLCLEPLRLVERSHFPRRRSLPARKLNHGFHRDLPTVMDNVIHSPLENKRVYTKDNFYINAIHPKEKEALLYESMLIDGKGSVNDIDAFFVTAPPVRTTLAPKRFGDNTLPDFVEISEGSVKGDEHLARLERSQRADLKLVTLPPQAASTVAPFKHNSVSPTLTQTRTMFALQPVRRQFVDPTLFQPNPVRFPAQPWQIPPLDPRPNPNPLAQFFQPIQQPAPLVPPNPFFPQQPNPQPTWTPPPPPPPNPIPPPPPARNDTFDPYIPIGVGQPPYSFQQTGRPSLVGHRQPVRPGGFARTFGQQPIPLPSEAAIDTAFNQARERELSTFPQNQIAKKPTPLIDYSIDSVAVVNKDQRPPPFVRSIPEKTSEQLRNFVKVHPQVMSNLQKPLIYRGKEMVIPKMFNFTSPPPRTFVPPPPPTAPQFPPQPVSVVAPPQPSSSYVPLMNPNQKLDLCCRKQRVGPLCQNLCNFDTFNDKTLVAAFLTNQCPGPQLGQAYDCASSKADHSLCCERAGLVSFQGGKCMPFCRTHVNTPSNVFDYFVCLQVFESIKGCYRDYQFSHPNVFGD